MFEVGQWIWGIAVESDNYDEADVSGYLFMAECGNYVICCAEDMSYEDDFKAQLDEMYKESLDWDGVSMNLLRKDLCFATKNEAKDYLDKLIHDEW